MLRSFIVVVAFALEALALILGLMAQGDGFWLLVAFLCHGAAAALSSLGLTRFLRRRPKSALGPEWQLLFLLVLLLGPLALPLVALAVGALERRALLPHYGEIPVPPHVVVAGGMVHFGQGGIAARIGRESVPVDSRLEALLRSLTLQGPGGVQLARAALGDSSESIRLLAQGSIQRREDDLLGTIRALRRRLSRTRDSRERARYLQSLAELTMEQCWLGLVRGELLGFLVRKARRYLRLARRERPEDPGASFALGRLHLMAGRHREARQAFEEAVMRGEPEVRVAPWSAELAFHARDFVDVRTKLAPLAHCAPGPRLGAVLRYWGVA